MIHFGTSICTNQGRWQKFQICQSATWSWLLFRSFIYLGYCRKKFVLVIPFVMMQIWGPLLSSQSDTCQITARGNEILSCNPSKNASVCYSITQTKPKATAASFVIICSSSLSNSRRFHLSRKMYVCNSKSGLDFSQVYIPCLWWGEVLMMAFRLVSAKYANCGAIWKMHLLEWNSNLFSGSPTQLHKPWQFQIICPSSFAGGKSSYT